MSRAWVGLVGADDGGVQPVGDVVGSADFDASQARTGQGGDVLVCGQRVREALDSVGAGGAFGVMSNPIPPGRSDTAGGDQHVQTGRPPW